MPLVLYEAIKFNNFLKDLLVSKMGFKPCNFIAAL